MSKSRIVQIEVVNPDAIAGVILIAEFTLTKLYHATHSAKQALWFANFLLIAFVRRA